MEKYLSLVALYVEALRKHSLQALVAHGQMPQQVLEEFAHLHYLFSTNWGTVIGTCKDRAQNAAFRSALMVNMGDELGISEVSHVTLCRQFLESLGLTPTYGTGPHVPLISVLPMTLMDSLPRRSEAFAAGYMFVSESIIPDMFQLFLPAFEARQADCTYLREHLHVDEVRHSKMLLDALESILAEGGSAAEAESGIHEGGRSIVCQADFFASMATNYPR